MAPRIEPLPPEGEEPSLNIFRTLRRSPDLFKAFARFGGYLLRDGGTVPARQREIVILRTGWRAGSEYEFGQHTVIGKAAGLSDDEVARIATAEGEWPAEDQALVDMVDELCADDAVSDSTWDALAAQWDDAAIMELLLLCGYYRLVSGFLNSVQVALEPGTPGWPEGAVAARSAPRV